MVQLERQIANEISDDVVRKLLSAMQMPNFFNKGSVPVKVAARVFGKSECFVRWGIENNILPIGTVEREPGKNRCNVYISPKLLWEYTGYVWKGEKE